MNKLTIPLSGINRSTDDSISDDGQCIELINARLKNGSIEPVGRPILEHQFTEGKEPVFIHKNGSYEHLISYFNNSVLFDSSKEDDKYVVQNKTICNLSGVRQLQSIGNFLIISTDKSIHYAIFANDQYTYLGDQIPEPDIHFSSIPQKNITSDEIWVDVARTKIKEIGFSSLNEESRKFINDSFKANYHKHLQENVYDKGFVVYPLLLRYAVRLFDGSYIMHSSPILIGDPKSVTISVTQTHFDDIQYLEDFTYQLNAPASEIGVRYNLSNLSAWKDVAASVDIFVSRTFVVNDLEGEIEQVLINQDKSMVIFTPNKTESNLIEEISETSNFYLVKSIPIGEISDGNENVFSEGKAFSNLEQKDHLSDDNFTRCKITGSLYAYNGRLHVGNIRTQLATPYPLKMWSIEETNPRQVNTEVHIKTGEGLKIIHGTSIAYGSEMTPYISYPDSRAVKIIFYDNNFYGEYALKPHSFLNLAYSIKHVAKTNLMFTPGKYNPQEGNSIEESPNKLKVSEVSNPIYFPAKQTYTISNRNIITMSTATTALSSGQFGQFPLYVFTGEGIYAMSVGTGDIAYVNSFPVTRDVCNNKDSVVSTDDAVVFSTDSGLKVLSGSIVQSISSDMEGYLPTSIDSSPIIKKVADVAGFGDKLSSTEFIYYLEKAKIGYNYEDKEIIVSNPNFLYSYVYNMLSGGWYKISASINRFLNSYPECLAVFNDHGLYNLHNGHRTINKILILTRPVKFGSLTHKRILQSAIRGVIRPAESLVYFRGETVKFRDQEILAFSNCGFYILGSNDAEHFTLLSGREKIEDVRDLITKMNKTKAYKYFMFCISGGVRTDVALSYIEVLIDETYQNRLR